MQIERVRQLVVFIRRAAQNSDGATPQSLQDAGFRPDEITQAVAEGYIEDYVTMGPSLVYVLSPQAELMAYRLGWQ